VRPPQKTNFSHKSSVWELPVIDLLQEESGVDVYRGIHIIQRPNTFNTRDYPRTATFASSERHFEDTDHYAPQSVIDPIVIYQRCQAVFQRMCPL
jgi:hypothetical protein